MTNFGHNGGPEIDPEIAEQGYTKEYRASQDHPIIGYGKRMNPADPDKDHCYSINEAWRDMLNNCRYREGRVINGGRTMTLYRGQLVGAVSWLGNRWNWTPKTVRSFLERLEKNGMIIRFAPGVTPTPDTSSAHELGITWRTDYIHDADRVKTQKGKQSQVLTICNYEKYQGFEIAKGQATENDKGKQGASKGQAEGNNIERKEEGKKENKLLAHASADAFVPVAAAPQPKNQNYAIAQLLAAEIAEACNPIIASTAACPGLLMVSDIVAWLDQGCDPNMDIRDPIKAKCADMKHKGSRNVIRSWNYFNSTVADAKTRRLAKLPLGQINAQRAAVAPLSADWELPGDWKAWALAEFKVGQSEVDMTARRFKNYALQKKTTNADWRPAWENWCLTNWAGKDRGSATSSEPKKLKPHPDRATDAEIIDHLNSEESGKNLISKFGPERAVKSYREHSTRVDNYA